MGLYLWGMLKEAGAEAYLTRMDDSNVYKGDDLTLKKDLQARAEFARDHEADLFISLHHNADVLPDAKKNSLETYFKMSDPGPSFDVARCLHRQLALSLGQTDNVILPGNFHVLRENPATAVLGEPSYISHADNAFRLGLAPMQRIEAQAYLLGIAEYFSKGVPRIEDMEPKQIVHDNPRLVVTARVGIDRGVPIDPESIVMLLDDKPVEAEFDREASQVTYLPAKRLGNGKHVVRLSLRNVNGNAARPAESEIEIAMPPAYVLLESNFPTVRPSSAQSIRLSARVFDADLLPVADGTPVEFEATSASLSRKVSLTSDGEAVTYLVPDKVAAPGEIAVSANASGLKHSLTLKVTKDAPEILVANLRDTNTNLPVTAALATVDGRPLRYSDDSGYFAVAGDVVGNSSVTFSRPGYKPMSVSLSGSTGAQFVKLDPIAGGVLFGQKFALDPQFGGEEKGATGPTGVRASDLNLLVADYLARFLRASGASVALTRESDETVSALRRVELAEKFGAQWFITIGHGGDASGQPTELGDTEANGNVSAASVRHYPVSEEGKRLAALIAGALRNEGIADTVTIEPSAVFVLTHTSSPAVMVLAPSPSTPDTEDRLRHPSAARREAYAIYCGILENFGLDETNTGEISLRVVDDEGNAVENATLMLDGVFMLETDSRGEFTFSRLTPGNHHIEVYSGGLRVWAGQIPVEASRTVSVGISLSGEALVLIPDIM